MSDDLAWETLDSEIAYSCPGFDVRRDEVRLPGGAETGFDYLVQPESVVVLPFTSEGEVVVIEEWRQAVGRTNWGLPAGQSEPGDGDLEATAHRELTEETGYVADRVEHLVSVEPMNGAADAVHHHFAAHDCIRNGSQDLDHDETIRVDRTTFDELYASVLRGSVRDGRTVTGVLYYGAVRSEES